LKHLLTTTLAIALAAAIPAAADTVIRRDGSRLDGRVVSLDDAAVTVETGTGTVRVKRSDVASIAFQDVAPPLRVEIRNVRSDDAVDVFVDDDPVIVGAREGGEWTDITARLKEGNNPIRLRIRNDRGTWAYRLSVRINGKVTELACGTALDRSRPCTCCGMTGIETGSFDLPPTWINVDRGLGRAEVLP
jgi:hypothetical protein